MLALAQALLPLLVFFGLQFVPAPIGKAGHVVAAPHDGYDQYTGTLAVSVANELGWGWVVATGYRSVPYRLWFDVNRPTERRWRHGAFGDDEETPRAREVYLDYQRRLLLAGRRLDDDGAEPLEVLVEVHGHSRSVRTSSGRLEVEAIELATAGFTRDELRRLEARYEELKRQLPADLRVPLAVDRLDPRYLYRGYRIDFYFTALGAKRNGSLRPELARKGLHFELPGTLRDTARARRYAAELIADLVREVTEN